MSPPTQVSLTPRDGIAYGVAALLAAASDDRATWALHRSALQRGIVPSTPAAAVLDAVGRVGLGPSLQAFLTGVDVEPTDRDAAIDSGEAAHGVAGAHAAQASLVELARRRNLAVVADRSGKLADLAAAFAHELVLHVP